MPAKARRVFLMLLIGGLLFASSSSAAEPTYRVVRRANVARQSPVVRSGYSYGWFGAKSPKHPERHFGYHRAYTQWSWR